MRVLVLGATGTIGRATVRALAARGHEVTAAARGDGRVEGARMLACDVTAPDAVALAIGPRRFDAVISCLASRTGTPADAWAIEHRAQSRALMAASDKGIGRFILVSAICVQKPMLEFQRAKLAFEAELQAADLSWTIVRPTAFFKSLSGQLARLRAGKPFLVFGDGRLTACKPISDDDLGAYIAECLQDPDRARRILPIGGPGPALTPREQGKMLFAALGRAPAFRSVPLAMLDAIVGTLAAGGRLSPRLRDQAERARIGRYYASQSMLVWDAAAGRYDADATPETGSATLADHYARLARGEVAVDLGDHAVF